MVHPVSVVTRFPSRFACFLMINEMVMTINNEYLGPQISSDATSSTEEYYTRPEFNRNWGHN